MDYDKVMWDLMWVDPIKGIDNNYIKIAVFSQMVSFAVTSHL